MCDRGKGGPPQGWYDADPSVRPAIQTANEGLGWTKEDNAGTFMINCGEDDAAPGNGLVDITYGYHAGGG